MQQEKNLYQQLEEIILRADEGLITNLAKKNSSEILEYRIRYEKDMEKMLSLTTNQETIKILYETLDVIDAYYQLKVIRETNQDPKDRSFTIG